MEFCNILLLERNKDVLTTTTTSLIIGTPPSNYTSLISAQKIIKINK